MAPCSNPNVGQTRTNHSLSSTTTLKLLLHAAFAHKLCPGALATLLHLQPTAVSQRSSGEVSSVTTGGQEVPIGKGNAAVWHGKITREVRE